MLAVQPRNKTITVFKINRTKPPTIASAVRRLNIIVEEMMQHAKLNMAIVDSAGLIETDESQLRMNVMKTRKKTDGKKARINAHTGNFFFSIRLFGSLSMNAVCYLLLQSANPE